MTDPIDYSKLSTDELFAQITPRSTGSVPTNAPAVVAPTPAPALASPPAAPAAEPDYSKMSTEELFASVQPRTPAAQPVETPKPDRTLLGELGHQVGLTGRAAVQGALALPGMVSDAITGPINAGLDAVAGEGNGFRFQRVSSAASNLMDEAGVAKPEGKLERVVQDAASGAAGALTGVGIGEIAAKASGPITKALGTMLADAPVMQTVSGASGGAAAGTVRENGGGAVAQGVAGLAGALAPTAVPFAAQTGLRGAIRGGEAGRQQIADNIATFEGAAGTTPTLGQATQNRAIQAAETGLTNVIGGHGIMARKAEQQANALQQSVQDLSERLAPGANPTEAGEAIARGVATFRDNVRNTQQRLYNALDRYIAPDAPTTAGTTLKTLDDLNAGIDGAENLSSWFRNGKLADLRKSLIEDLEAAREKMAPPSARSSMMNYQPPSLDKVPLPYESIKKLRTLAGQELADTNFTSDINRSVWSKVYAALSDDLGGAAKAAGPQAEQAWSRANTFTRLASERMEQIGSIINKDAPEHVFKAATSGLADGGTQIRRLMKSMPVENRREVAAAVLQRLGRAKNSAQDELGSVFSSETFLTNLAAMSPAARSALFTNSGFPGLQQRINQMGRMASVRREGSTVFANPSGTARLLGLGGWVTGLVTAIGAGNSAGIASAVAIPLGARFLANRVTSPGFVQSMATRAQLSEAALPALAGAAARMPPIDERPGLRRMREARAAKASPKS
jgi:hypothetical protein